MTLRIGLIVNPIAGIGGASGHKGSDHDWKAALDAGFEPRAPGRAQRLKELVGDAVTWHDAGLQDRPLGSTTRTDTLQAAHDLAPQVDLLVFVGGDGTATDIAEAIGQEVPCLGVPGGVKITSPVFSHDVQEAAWLLQHLPAGFETTVRDVTDLDEKAYREGRVETRLTGALRVPLSPIIQGGKCATSVETPLEPLVEQVLRDWDKQALHFIGAGSVCQAIKKQFWGTPTLLGIDAIQGDRIIETDLDGPRAEALLAAAAAAGQAASEPPRIVLSTIGGQGMLLGRGTHVLTPRILAAVGWDRMHVVAPPEKLVGLRGLHADCDPAFLASAPKYIRVTAGWNETRMLRLNPPPKDPS